MSIMNVMIERKIALQGYRKYRKTIWETDSRVEYFFQRSTSATDGKDIRLYRMEKWFVDVMKTLVQRRMKVWKRCGNVLFSAAPFGHDLVVRA